MRQLFTFLLIAWVFLAQAQSVTLYPKSASNENGFELVKPSTYTTAKKYQLYVFLHGVGGRGDGSATVYGLNRLTGGELPTQLRDAAEKNDFVILAPQTAGDWGTSEVNNMITWAKANLSIDWTINRNVITGLSLGGGGVWRYISSSVANAQNFATAIPVCGLNWLSSASNVVQSKIAIWAFHSNDDGTVGYNNSTTAITSVNALSPVVPAYLTTYTSGQHYIWGRVYDPLVKPGVLNETVDIYAYAKLNKVGTPVAIPTQGPVNGLIADAGTDQTVSTANINLNGLNSRGYARAGWQVTQVPTGVNTYTVITAGGGWITASATLPKAGAYTFRLSVYNAAGQVQTDDVNVNFDNGAPVPTPDKKITNVATSVENGLIVLTITWSDGTTTVIK